MLSYHETNGQNPVVSTREQAVPILCGTGAKSAIYDYLERLRCDRHGKICVLQRDIAHCNLLS